MGTHHLAADAIAALRGQRNDLKNALAHLLNVLDDEDADGLSDAVHDACEQAQDVLSDVNDAPEP